MRFDDLSRECQSDTTSRGLGRIERHKRVARIQESQPVIVDGQDHALIFDHPIQRYLRLPILHGVRGVARTAMTQAWLKRCFDSVAHEINEHLLNLVRIHHQRDIRTARDRYCDPRLEENDLLHNREERDSPYCWRWHLGQLSIGLEKPVERCGSSFD